MSTGLPPNTSTDLPNPTASPATPAEAIPTITPIECLKDPGIIEVHEIQHPDFVSPVRLRAYVPPCYQQDLFASYPVLILLHGLLATDTQWVDLGVTEMADSLIQSGEFPPFIILLPWIRNSQDPVKAVMEAVVPFTMEQWRVSDQRKFWGIGGLSRGGGQALQIALLHPEQFSAIGLHSPATLHTPKTLVNWYLVIENTQRPQIWLDMGTSDSLMQSALALLDTFQEAQIPVTQRFSEGDHTTSYWMRNLPFYLSWYRSFWIPSP